MIRDLVVLSATVALASALQFTDCATCKCNTVMKVHQFDISPSPIVIPGEILISINLTINKPITHLFIDTAISMYGQGIWSGVPCNDLTNFGTCNNIDACALLDNLRNCSSLNPQGLAQFDAMLFLALGHTVQCPIQPEAVSIINQKVTVKQLPLFIGAWGTDDPTNPDNLGCIQFEFDVATGEVTQPLVG